MILTVTPNPTIDRVLFVRDFAMQDMVRAEGETIAPSGKGIDVLGAAARAGVETLALGLSAGLSGDMLAALMDEIGAPYEFIPANGYTRVAALITDKAQGRQSTIVAHTLTAEPAHLDRCWRGRKLNCPRVGAWSARVACPPACLSTPTRGCSPWGKRTASLRFWTVPAKACATAWPRCRISSRST